MSGFIERLIEDWLIKADERGYQLPFAAVLSKQGHVVKMVSHHSTGEHGKDIVSVSPDRKVNAYQLKAGDISTREWRQIDGEVRECASVPISVPGMSVKVPDRAFLVLSGQLSDPVREKLNLINQDNAQKGWPTIETIELAQLVGDFARSFEEFFPQAVTPLHELMRLYLQDGKGTQDKDAFAGILASMLSDATTRQKAKRCVSNIVVASEFAASAFRKSSNYVSEIETWVFASTYILQLAKRMNLPGILWHGSLDLCKAAIDVAAQDLLSEVYSRPDFIEGDAVFDGQFLPYRRTIVLGFVSAILNSQCISGEDITDRSGKLRELMLKQLPMRPWGEGAWTLYLNLALALRHTPEGETLAEDILHDWLKFACPHRSPWPREPYWTVDDEIGREILGEDDVDYERARVTFSAAAASGILVRRMRRQAIANLWPDLGRFEWSKFVPPELWMHLSWRVEEGVNELAVQPYRVSWAKWRSQAYSQRSNLFDDREKWLLPYFLCVFPHRTDPQFSGELDYATSPQRTQQSWDTKLAEITSKT
ncbi:MAG TPA: hypothetical protein VJB57_05925 [Dehalococcoidia bacterium]|nr:hypothetical protein [Dehalococcoidia bacterium]